MQSVMLTSFKRSSILVPSQTIQARFVNERARTVSVPKEFLCIHWTQRKLLHSQSELGVPVERRVSRGGYSHGFTVFMGEDRYFLKLGLKDDPKSEGEPVFDTLNEHAVVIKLLESGFFDDAPPSLNKPFKVGAVTCPEINDGAETPAILYELLLQAPLHDASSGFTLKTRFSLLDIQKMMLTIMPGLLYLHERGYAHRDIGPHNMTPSCLYDYGKVISFTDSVSEFSFFVPYLPPELDSHNTDPLPKDFSHTLDLWQLGCTLFQLAITSYPFEILASGPTLQTITRGLGVESADFKTTAREIYHAMTHHPFVKWTTGYTLENSPELASFCDLVSRLLQINPADRSTVDALLMHPFFSIPCRADLYLVPEPVVGPQAAAVVGTAHPTEVHAHGAVIHGYKEWKLHPRDTSVV